MEEGILKPKTQRHKRFLEKRAPKVRENDKITIFIRGGNTSNIVTKALADLHVLKKPNSIQLKKRNIARPFEDATSIEFLTKMNDAPLFLFGSHSKKRPHNLVMGRTFDNQILDMIELGIENYISLRDIKEQKCGGAFKPCLMFCGNEFESDDELRRLKNLFTDFFRGPVVENISLKGLEHVIQFTAMEGKVYFRSYRVLLKKSGTRTPRVELEEIGPRLDLILRRTRLASRDLFKLSCKQPRQLKAKKKKNISGDIFGRRLGRIHMTKQDVDSIQLRKVKALKRKLDKKLDEEEAAKSQKTEDVGSGNK